MNPFSLGGYTISSVGEIMHKLNLTFNLKKGFPGFSRFGLNWFMRSFFFDTLPKTSDGFMNMLAKREGLSRKILQKSSLLEDFDVESILENSELDNEAQEPQASKILDHIISRNRDSTPEYWAAMILYLIPSIKECIKNQDGLNAALFMSHFESAYFMLNFKRLFFEDTIWLGHAVTKLEDLLKIWDTNKDNDDEDFWQAQLSENSLLLSQVFSFPVIILEDKAYMGGKSIDDKGGNLVDFLLKNRLSQNTVLVEIKTPKTKLLGSKYRNNIYHVSKELTGAINQVLNYKDSLLKKYHSLAQDYEDDFYAFNPKCLIIVGNIENEITDQTRRRSFELFRNELRNVEIITYDELFDKVKILIDLFSNVEY